MSVMSPRQLELLVGDLSTGGRPLYAELAARLRLLVGDGRLPLGVRLPGERDLAHALHLSRATVASAYGLLREQGWASARQGSGTWTRVPTGPAPGPWAPAPVPDGVLDLAHAAPAAPPQVRAAFAAALDDLPRLLPGHGYHPQGLPELRARIAARHCARGLPTTPEQVLVTAGALHAISIAVRTLVPRGGRVVVEHPTYPSALDVIRELGCRMVPAAVAAGEPAAAVRDISRAARQSAARAAYLMLDFQNPTGLLVDEAQRRRLAVAFEQLGTVAVVDETLVDLNLDADVPPSLAALARPGTVVAIGSMSKSFWGGLRIGWIRAEEDVLRRLAVSAAHTQLSQPVLEQLAACHLFDVEDDVLAARRGALRRQRDALVSAVRRCLPEWEAPLPSGGLVVWCRLPSRSSTAIAAAAKDRGLLLAAGPRFGTGHALDDHLRLPFTQPVDVLQRGVELLADIAGGLATKQRVDSHDQLVV